MAKSISEQLSEKTMQELKEAKNPKAQSRSWQDPTGYRFLTPWSNAVLLRILIRTLTVTFPKSEYRRKSQMDDAIRSVVRNIEEGFKRSNTKDYLNFLGYSQGSLEEVKGDARECLEDGLLESRPGTTISDLGIDLKTWNDWCQDPLNSSKFPYFPLRGFKGILNPVTEHSGYGVKDIKGQDLTYEIFIELINKTDWLLRRLVLSLEQKLENYKRELGGIRK